VLERGNLAGWQQIVTDLTRALSRTAQQAKEARAYSRPTGPRRPWRPAGPDTGMRRSKRMGWSRRRDPAGPHHIQP